MTGKPGRPTPDPLHSMAVPGHQRVSAGGRTACLTRVECRLLRNDSPRSRGDADFLPTIRP
jgi:hypothetical protein